MGESGASRSLDDLVARGERENVEFKEFLSPGVHLSRDRLETLACQMNHRLLAGGGTALYVIGISDDGAPADLDPGRVRGTLEVLEAVAAEVGARVSAVELAPVNGSRVGLITIERTGGELGGLHGGEAGGEPVPPPGEGPVHLLIGTAGHVHHGKSTLVGTLTTRHRDDGAGRTRLYLDLLPHEVERLLSAELSYGLYGFRGGRPIYLRDPRDKRAKAAVVERAERLVSFLDTVGHEPWLRTTIRGIVGQRLDYGLLVVAADDGVTHITREHLGVLLAMELPVLVVVTKVDRVPEKRRGEVVQEVADLLGRIGRSARPVSRLEEMKDLLLFPALLRTVVPVFQASAVTLEGFDLLDAVFRALPPRAVPGEAKFQLYVDKVYSVAGVGPVLSGTVKQGRVRAGEVLRLGPREDGSFAEVRVQSIEIHHYRVDRARAGDVVGIAVRGVRASEVRRGMVLASEPPGPVREFEAEVTILNHPTRIKQGYEPVVHMETICESARFTWMERPYMMAGQRGRVRMEFKFRPYAVTAGQKFLFREGKSKGVGKVVRAVK